MIKWKLICFVLMAVFLLSCAVKTQKNRIRDARIGVAAAGIALDAGGKASAEYFENYPSDNTEKYCQGEVALFILDAMRITLVGAANTIKLWETALAIYLAKKDQKTDTKMDWTAVLDSEAAWRKMGGDVLGVFNLLRSYLDLAGIVVPSALGYAWNFLNGFLGSPSIASPEMNWKSLKGGVCGPYLPGGE